MSSAMPIRPVRARPPRPRAQDIDKRIGARIRDRRVMLGLTQQQLAELIGVTYQQAHKYEKGINRIAAGRLPIIAEALGVEVDYFFQDLEAGTSFRPTSQQRMLLELARNFTSMPDRRHQDVLCTLARALAEPGAVVEPTADAA